MRKSKEIISWISAALILLSAMGYFAFPSVAPWTMIVGTVFFSYIIVTSPYPGKSMRGKRLFNFQLLACALFAVVAYLMFIGKKEWILALTAGSILLLYSSIVIPKEIEKEKKD